MLKELSKDGLEKEEGSYKRRPRKHRACKNGLLEATVYTYKEGSLRISLWIGCIEDTKNLNYAIWSLNRLYRYSFN
jgi:hypothetical protein